MFEIYVLFLKQTLCNHYKLYLPQKKLKQTHKLVNTNYYVTLTQLHTVWNTALTMEKTKYNQRQIPIQILLWMKQALTSKGKLNWLDNLIYINTDVLFGNKYFVNEADWTYHEKDCNK